MNRKERRTKGIKNSEPVINIKVSDIEKIKDEASKNAIDTAFTLMLGMPLLVMRDKYGFGKVRLERYIEQIFEIYDSFNKDYITLEDMHKVLYDEVGVTITKK